VWNNKAKYYPIHTSIEWDCKKDEYDVGGKSKGCA